MNRGNHEAHTMNQMYGFEHQISYKYSGETGRLIYFGIKSLFELLPLVHIVGGKIFVIILDV